MRGRPVRAWLPSVLLVAGACGLLLGTFLDWYAGAGVEGAYFNRAMNAPAYAGVFSVWGHGENAWEAFAGLDIALAAFAALALLAGLGALRSAPSRAWRIAPVLTTAGGLGVAVWTLERVFDRPTLIGLGPGAVVGFASVVVACIGAALALPAVRGAQAP